MSPRSLVIDGIGDASQVVQPRPGFDPGTLSRYAGEFHSVWSLVGSGMSVQDIVTSGVVTPSHAIAVVRQLLDVGALQMQGAGESGGDVPIVDDSELGALTDEERALFAEKVDLSDLEKRRILVAARTLRGGSFYELLGVSPQSNPRDVKRAYFNLSKEFHPDRFYSRNLGPYKRLLEAIFERAADAVKILSDARTVMPGDSHAAQRRRRQLERFPFTARARVRCESWSDIHALITLDVSAGGVFLVSTHLPKANEEVAVGIQTPGGETLKVRGEVAFVRTNADARRLGRRPGFGVHFVDMDDEQKATLLQLVSHARSSMPAFGNPTEAPDESPPSGRRRMARGTGANQAIIGIDLGTSYTSVSATVDGKIRLLRWPDRELSIPSVVSFPSRDSVLVGKAAKARLLTDPNHTVPSAKRLLGRQASDNEVAAHLAQAAYDVSSSQDGQVLINMWGEPYAMPQLVGYLLGAAREAAEQSLQSQVEKAVVTVPVSFGADRIELLRRAGRLAHLDIVEVIDEPSAAALASRYRPDFGGLIGVYDFGGGTFDFSIVDASGGDFRVLATAGDSWLGGDDFDSVLADAIAEKFWRVHGVDLRMRAVEWQQLLFESERAKRGLSQLDTVMMSIPEVCRTQQGTVNLKMRLGRQPVNRLWEEPIRRSITTCMQALAMVGLEPHHLSGVYLAGGTTYLPAVRNALQSYFGRPVQSVVPPEFAGCLGAGVHAAQLTHRVSTTLSTVA